MSSYKYASVTRLTMDDPCNEHLEEGTILLTAGKHEETYTYAVLDEDKEGFTDVECEVLGVLEADYRMNKDEIEAWAADQDRAHELAQEAEA